MRSDSSSSHPSSTDPASTDPASGDPASGDASDAGAAGADSQAITTLLQRSSDGDVAASERVIALLYDELHRLAQLHMRGQKRGHSLQPTALVHEAYLKLFRDAGREYSGREHFLALASRAMRTVLVDHARARGRQKRRAQGDRVPLEALVEDFGERAIDLLALDHALQELQGVDPELTRLVELRFFGGLTMAESAEQLGWPLRRAEREWQTARAWLRKHVEGRGA